MGCKDYGPDLIQWFRLNFILNPHDPEAIRQYSTFLRFNNTIPGGKLEDFVKDKEILNKILNYTILR